ncbi:DUF504 domain-containing protein [Methanopyrus sp.]
MAGRSELREIISKMLYDPREDPSRYVFYVVDRGAASRLREVRGDEIERVERGFLRVYGAEIPLHRVVRVVRDGRVIWERGRRAPGDR